MKKSLTNHTLEEEIMGWRKSPSVFRLCQKELDGAAETGGAKRGVRNEMLELVEVSGPKVQIYGDIGDGVFSIFSDYGDGVLVYEGRRSPSGVSRFKMPKCGSVFLASTSHRGTFHPVTWKGADFEIVVIPDHGNVFRFPLSLETREDAAAVAKYGLNGGMNLRQWANRLGWKGLRAIDAAESVRAKWLRLMNREDWPLAIRFQRMLETRVAFPAAVSAPPPSDDRFAQIEARLSALEEILNFPI